MAYYMGIDLGTTGLKALIVDANGKISGSGYREYPLNVPQAGYAEQNPEDWYRAMCLAIGDALASSKIPPREIRCLGFSGQMHGLVALDGENRVLCPAIIHCDGRASLEKREILERVGIPQLGQWVQNQVHSGFQALSLLWLRHNRPEIYGRIRHALLPKDYLRFTLTGEIGAEPTDASGTLMYDCKNRRWSEELIRALEIDPAILPDCNHLPHQIAGRLTREAAEATGLSEGMPVAYGGGDQPMQAVGNGLLFPGSASVTLGTSGQVFVPSSEPVYDPLLRTHTFCHAPEKTWYVMGAVLNACLAFNWFLENVLRDRDFAAIDQEAQTVSPGSEGLLFLPYLTGERTPHMNEHARAAFIGLSLAHDRKHMARAVMEGVALCLKDALEVVRELHLPIDRMVVSGGGAKSRVWRQILSDVFEMPLYVSRMKEQAGLGAAITAQVAAGEYSSLEEACRAIVRYEPEPVEPNPGNFSAYRSCFDRFRLAYRQNLPLFG